MPKLSPGALVWYQPALIGYGYQYGVDVGIPARVLYHTPKRVVIKLWTKAGEPRVVGVAQKNLIPRTT